jgi:flagellar basal body L-ring protein FlgH
VRFTNSLLVLFLFLQGCAWVGNKKSPFENVDASPKVGHKLDVEKPAKREPGSLWSETSSWNRIYDSSGSRQVGDTLTMKVNEPFKERILMAMNEGKKADSTKSNDGKAETRETASANQSSAKKDDTSVVDATILEVLPNKSYRIGVNRAFKIGRERPYVVLEGQVKEREIAADDSFSSDALMNMKVDTFDEQKHAVPEETKTNPEVASKETPKKETSKK